MRDTMPFAGTPCIEASAVMAKYNPFFEKAGMKKIAESKPNKYTTNALKQLEDLGFDVAMFSSKVYIEQKLMQTGTQPIINILTEISKHDHTVSRRIAKIKNVYPTQEEFVQKIAHAPPQEIAETLSRLGFCTQSKVYLFWDANEAFK